MIHTRLVIYIWLHLIYLVLKWFPVFIHFHQPIGIPPVEDGSRCDLPMLPEWGQFVGNPGQFGGKTPWFSPYMFQKNHANEIRSWATGWCLPVMFVGLWSPLTILIFATIEFSHLSTFSLGCARGFTGHSFLLQGRLPVALVSAGRLGCLHFYPQRLERCKRRMGYKDFIKLS